MKFLLIKAHFAVYHYDHPGVVVANCKNATFATAKIVIPNLVDEPPQALP